MDSTIEDPHSEAGSHLGAGASAAMGVARLTTALLARQRAQRTTKQELLNGLRDQGRDPSPTLDKVHPAIGSAYRETHAIGADPRQAITADGDRKMAIRAAADRGEAIVAERQGDGAFVVTGMSPTSQADPTLLDDTREESRNIRTADGTLHASLGAHTQLEWATIDGHLSIDQLGAERARREAFAASPGVDSSALNAAADARSDARDAEATPDDPATVTIDEHKQGVATGGSDRARANSYVTQAFPAATPDLSAPVTATPSGPPPAVAAVAKVARFKQA